MIFGTGPTVLPMIFVTRVNHGEPIFISSMQWKISTIMMINKAMISKSTLDLR